MTPLYQPQLLTASLCYCWTLLAGLWLNFLPALTYRVVLISEEEAAAMKGYSNFLIVAKLGVLIVFYFVCVIH